jgi:hypothetical protein
VRAVVPPTTHLTRYPAAPGLPVRKDGVIGKMFLPTPVGMRGSGPARLSDLSVSKRQAAEAAEREALLKENEVVQPKEEPTAESKFFGNSRRLGTRGFGASLTDDDIQITFHPTGPMLTPDVSEPASAPLLVDDGDTFPELSSPPAACSSLQSPGRSSQHGSHFSSPGRESEEENKLVEFPESSGSSYGRKRRSLLPASPSDRLSSKRRRLTVTPPRGEPILAAASSPIQLESPSRQESKTDLRKLCGADDSSSFHADWEASLKHERQLDLSDDDGSQEKMKARAVAKGLRAKYTYTPKVSR